MKGIFRGALIALLATCLAANIFAQGTTADVLGTITDASGAALPNAKVTITNLATNESRTAQSSGTGDYVFSLLSPSGYAITVEAQGFQTAKVPGLQISAGDRARADVQMRVGDTQQAIEVSAQAPALQTDNSSLASTVTERAVQDLPLNGRNFVNLIQNSPGVTVGNPNGIGSGNRPDDRRMNSVISANGQPEAYNNNMVDGIDNNERQQGLIMIRPSIDSIQEVRVETNVPSAEYGRSASAVVNVITKSGGNAFHGTLFEFFRNQKLDANYFFNNRAGAAKPDFHQNQYGGSLSGPIVKDKTFFFGDFEGYRISQGQPSGLLTVPTAFQQANPGNFSDIGGTTIPFSQIDPVALNYFKLYPLPNVPGATQVNNFNNSPRRTQFSKTIETRLDHRFSDRDSIFGRYSWNPVDTLTPGPLPVVNGIAPGGAGNPGPNFTRSHGAQLNYIHIFSSSLIAEVKAGYMRLNLESRTLNQGTNAGQKFGMPNVNYDSYNTGLANVSISGYVPLGDATFIPIIDINNTFQYNGTVSYTKGSHNIKIGAGLIRRQVSFYQPNAGQGTFAFAGSQPQSMANFLLGTATTITRSNQLYMNYMRSWEPDTFIVDNWRATRWLTLNLGFRWDYFSPQTSPTNQRANFDLSTLKMRLASPSDPTAGVDPDYKNFAPRIGFAADLGHQMVLRGGFGLVYYPYDGAGGAMNSFNPPFIFGLFTCQPASTNPALQCPSGIGKLSQGPPVPYLTDPNNLSGGLRALPRNARSSYMEQFNLTLQKQFGQNVVTASYIGQLGRRQLVIVPAHLPAPTGTATIPPFVYQAQLPNVNNIQLRAPLGESAYNALQLSFERRYSRGLVFNTGYTWSNNLNDFPQPNGGLSTVQLVTNNRKYDWGNADIAVRHRFTLQAAYEFPWGKSFTGLKKHTMAGWQINSIAYWQSGLPFTVMNGAFAQARINLPGVTSDRPSVRAGQSFAPASQSIASWFNTAAFEAQAIGTPGNQGRNQLWGPAARQLDLSLFKNFPVTEQLKLQFRAEAYNITNTANFGQPNANITRFTTAGLPDPTTGLGTITSTRLGLFPRQIQLALKLTF